MQETVVDRFPGFRESDGAEVRREFNLRKMSFYGLTNLITHIKTEPPGLAQEWWDKRAEPFFGEAYDLRSFGEKPSAQDKKMHAERRARFLGLIKPNKEYLIRSLLKQSQDHRWMYRKGQKDVNQAIFLSRLAYIASALAHSEGVQAVMDDVALVRAVLQDQSRFAELEQICRAPMGHFLDRLRISTMDQEDQHQEGRLAIWAAAKKYEGRNFARFSSMVRTALHNRYVDLLKYSLADRRRIQKFTDSMGATPTDSLLAYRVDGVAYAAWLESQRSGAKSPFATRPVLEYGDHIIDRPVKEERVVVRARTYEEFDLYQDPGESLSELVSEEEIVQRKKGFLQSEYLQALWGEATPEERRKRFYVNEKGELDLRNPSAEFVRIRDEFMARERESPPGLSLKRYGYMLEDATPDKAHALDELPF